MTLATTARRSRILGKLAVGAVAWSLLVLAPNETRGETNLLDRFNAANAAFAAGHYDEASTAFRALIDDGHISTAILFDLANAEARAGRVGKAVLYYERALSLSPRNPDVLTNLRHVRAAAELPPRPRSRWQELAATLSVDQWAWLAAAALWAGCLLLASHALRSSPQDPLSRQKLGGTLAIGLVLIVSTLLATTRLEELEHGVVVGAKPGLREAPFDAATISIDLAPGEIVRIERSHGDFVLARTAEDEAGWMRAESARPILAPWRP